MKRILVLVNVLLIPFGVYAQNGDNKPITDSFKTSTPDYGVVSKKAIQGKYAILNIYRSKSRKKSFAGFTININDSAVCKIKSNTRYTIKLYKFGTTEIWAKSESRSNLTMKVEMGKEYYLKCKVKMGVWAEVPNLVQIDPLQGKTEFDEAEDDF